MKDQKKLKSSGSDTINYNTSLDASVAGYYLNEIYKAGVVKFNIVSSGGTFPKTLSVANEDLYTLMQQIQLKDNTATFTASNQQAA